MDVANNLWHLRSLRIRRTIRYSEFLVQVEFPGHVLVLDMAAWRRGA